MTTSSPQSTCRVQKMLSRRVRLITLYSIGGKWKPILNGIRCSLLVLDVFCGYFPLLVKYLVDIQHTYTTMWKGDIVNPAQVGWSVICELLGPFVIRKPLDIEFYDCGGKDGWDRADRWKSCISRVWQFLSTNLLCLYDYS